MEALERAFHDEIVARVYRRYADAPARQRRDGLRRPPDGHGPAPGGRRGRAGPLADALPATSWWTSTRTPTTPSTAWCARWASRSATCGRRRRRPGRSTRWRGADVEQHPRLRARLPRRDGGGAGAELPLHRDHPAGGERRGVAEPAPAPEAALDGSGRRRADPGRGVPGRARGGPHRGRRDRRRRQRGVEPVRGVAVFYRTNAQSRAIEDQLVRRQVPYIVVGGPRFYERAEVRDLLAYLRAVANPADGVSLARMLGAPKRGLGPGGDREARGVRRHPRAAGGRFPGARGGGAGAPAGAARRRGRGGRARRGPRGLLAEAGKPARPTSWRTVLERSGLRGRAGPRGHLRGPGAGREPGGDGAGGGRVRGVRGGARPWPASWRASRSRPTPTWSTPTPAR